MFSSLTVSRRLHLGFGLILLILAGVSVMAILKVNTINQALTVVSEDHGAVQRQAINLRGAAHDTAIAIRDVVLSSNVADRQREVASISELAAFYGRAIGSLEKLFNTADRSSSRGQIYASIRDIEARATTTTQAIIAAVNGGELARAQSLLWGQAKLQYVQWLEAINKLIDLEERGIQKENQTAHDQSSGFLTVMAVAVALALLTGGALAWVISRSILGQLGAEPVTLGNAARRVADGDLSAVPGADRAPVGSVLASLGSMQQSLSQVVGQVRSASDSIATGSQEIASGNSDLSHRTESQASSLQQTSASMQQLSQTVLSNADTAAQANRMAGTASTAAAKGGEVVGQVVATMQDIYESSRKISDIIGVIDGIAFQTNILALNAAVEAARAGEQGRGFAVVASEVRSLAQRSANAAREIKTLINASVDKVENGTRLVGDAGQTMDTIVHEVRQVSELISRISNATAHQTQDIGQVGQAVGDLDQSTQQNAALVQQSAAAAESLHQQAVRLAQTVGIFKLVDGPGMA